MSCLLKSLMVGLQPMEDDNRLNLSLSLSNEGQSGSFNVKNVIRPYARAEEACSGRKRKFTFDEINNHQKRQLTEALVDNSLDKGMAPHTVKFVAPSAVLMDLPVEQERQSFRKELEHEREAFRKELEHERETFWKKFEEQEGLRKELENERETFRKEIEKQEGLRKKLEHERETIRKELENERETFRKGLENERQTFRKEFEKQEGLRKKLEHERETLRKELEEREGFRKEGEILRKELEQERESFRNKLENEQETFQTERETFRRELEKERESFRKKFEERESFRKELEETLVRMVEVEDENSELELAAREAAWKEQNMVKEMETILADTEDSKRKLLAATTDIEWLIRNGISSTIRRFLRSHEFIEAQCIVNRACIDLGVDIICKLMRDMHVPSLPDSSLPFYKPKAWEKVLTAVEALVYTDYELLTGFSDGRITLEDLRWLSNL